MITKPDARIVIYVRKNDHKEIVADLLDKLNLSASNLKTFNEINHPSEGVKIFILVQCSMNSVDHLINVSHLLFIEPFIGVADSETSKINNVIIRQSPFKVIRFILKDAFEKRFIKYIQGEYDTIKNK